MPGNVFLLGAANMQSGTNLVRQLLTAGSSCAQPWAGSAERVWFAAVQVCKVHNIGSEFSQGQAAEVTPPRPRHRAEPLTPMPSPRAELQAQR